MQFEYDPNDKFWDEAYEWAYQHASEEGDVDFDRDDELIHAWAEEYYNYLIGQKN